MEFRLKKPRKFPVSVLAVLLLELLNPSSRIKQFLLAGEERVACTADFHFDLLPGGTGCELVTASTFDFNLLVLWVNILSHDLILRSSPPAAS